MITKIRYKLFLVILAANGLLLVAVYLSASWIFSTSFRDYLDRSEADRLQPLVQELSLLYQQQGNWHWVKQRRRIWRDLMDKHIGRPERPRRNREFKSAAPPPKESRDLLAVTPKLLLKDQRGQLIIGGSGRAAKAYWVPIEVDDMSVGQLGFVRRVNIDMGLDRLFADRVQSTLAWLMLAMLFITGLIAIPFAAVFVRPIENLRNAFHQLASGNFEVRSKHTGNDEIASLQVDFNRLAETMSQNLKARQRWVADIAHELRTPIAVLQGEIEAILDGVRQIDSQAIQSLHQETLRLSRLVDDLHELSLSDVGALSYQNQQVDLVDLLRNLVEQQNRLHPNEALTIEFEAMEAQYSAFADPQRLQQLFTNLAANSRFYTEVPGKIRVSLSREGEQARIEWQDSTPGVSDADLDLMFDRLYRVDASRNRNAGGSGLGLAICRNIVEAMDGRIEARHAALGGVAIVVTLPLAN